MSRILLLAVLLLNSLTSFAILERSSIKGTIQNQGGDEVVISYVLYDGNWLNYEFKTEKVKLDSKGRFIANLDIKNNYTEVKIKHGKYTSPVYMSPGDKLSLTADGGDIDNTIEYKGIGGTDASVANFMAKHEKLHGSSNDFYRAANELRKEDATTFNDEINKLMQKELDFLIDHGMGLPSDFVEFWNANYEYSMYYNMLTYSWQHKRVVNDDSPTDYSLVAKVPAKFDDKYMHVMYYRYYTNGYHEALLQSEAVTNNKNDLGKEYMLDDKKLELAFHKMPPKTAEYVFAEHISSGIKYGAITRTDYLFGEFKNRYDNSDYTNFLKGEIEKKKSLSAGAPAKDFLIGYADGEKTKLSDLKGKVVYIDFWASWCGPCIGEFKHAKKLKEHFKGNDDVVFLYVSIDKSTEAWEKALKKHKLTGVHTRVDPQESQVVKDYNVKGIPSYFLVNKEGKFVVDSTPRPSSGEEIINLIQSQL